MMDICFLQMVFSVCLTKYRPVAIALGALLMYRERTIVVLSLWTIVLVLVDHLAAECVLVPVEARII